MSILQIHILLWNNNIIRSYGLGIIIQYSCTAIGTETETRFIYTLYL